jgi:hypothetical protein
MSQRFDPIGEAQASGSLRAELADLRALFQQAPGYMAVLRRPDRVYALVNDAHWGLVGEGDLIGRPAREAMAELAGQGFLELLDQVSTTGKPFVGHQMLRNSSGKWIAPSQKSSLPSRLPADHRAAVDHSCSKPLDMQPIAATD